MSERYRLTFRGEVLDGQHPAVVRKKLGQLLSLDDARLDRLFSGESVVVKAEVDADTAARYLDLFRNAGARLRASPLPAEPAGDASPPAGAADRRPPVAEPQVTEVPPLPVVTEEAGFDPDLLPVGSDVLREDERERWVAREIDTAHLALQPPDAALPEAPRPPPPPDISRLSLIDP